jgi:hypothetical protein
MTLSILIPTLNSRTECREALLRILKPQVDRHPGEVELLILEDDGKVPTGTKRNQLMEQSKGAYIAFVDDDDLVSVDYVERILGALNAKPDCVGFQVKRTTAGKITGLAVHSLKYRAFANWHLPDGQWFYERTPNHLCPIRREIAIAAQFPAKTIGEDQTYASRVRPHLQTECFLAGVLYHYQVRPPR